MTGKPTRGAALEELVRLADDVDQEWRASEYDERLFSSICESAMRASALLGEVDITDGLILDLVMQARLPQQLDPTSTFANPPVTVVRTDRFVVDVYFWLDGTTTIHQHSFSGAFGVLAGSSLHSTFRFVESERCNQHLSFGQVRRLGTELLERGAVRRIEAGAPFIHSLFHLDRPSVSLVIRTIEQAASRPQLSYLPPTISYDSDAPPERLDRAIELIIMAFASGRDDAPILAGAYAARADTHSRFTLLRRAQERLELIEFERLLECVCLMDSRLSDNARPAFAEHVRQHNIISRRKEVTDPEHRLFLALLLNLESWQDIRSLLLLKFPACSPEDKVTEWVQALAVPDANREPNRLGIHLDGSALEVFELLLHGTSNEKVAETLREKYGSKEIDAQADVIEELCKALRGSLIFAPLFRRSSEST